MSQQEAKEDYKEEEDELVQMRHGKRNRDTEEDGDTRFQEAEVKDTREEVEEADSAVPTNQDFNKLIQRKHKSISWVGNYTTAHTTGIEIGFLKKEAKALVTLLCYYQVDGNGATACPVAMISGPASFGRKLAIFYSSCDTRHGSFWYSRDPRAKVPLGQSFKMENQSLKTLAKLGRMDYYLGTLKGKLEEGMERRGLGVTVTDERRLVMNSRVYGLCGRKAQTELTSFVTEVFRSGQTDVIALLVKHLAYDERTLFDLCSSALNNGYTAIVDLLLRTEEPSLLAGGAKVQTLLTLAIVSAKLDIIKLIVNYGGDMTKADIQPDNQHLSSFPIHAAILGENIRTYSWYFRTCSPPIELVRFVLDQGAQVNVTNSLGHTPLCLAIFATNEELLRLLLSYAKSQPGVVDLVNECSKGLRTWHVNQDQALAWLKRIGLVEGE